MDYSQAHFSIDVPTYPHTVMKLKTVELHTMTERMKPVECNSKEKKEKN